MGKTPAPSRAGRKPRSMKNRERKWCTCQERCNGGKEVAASTYRSHNPTATRASAVLDGLGDGSVGGKKKSVDDLAGVGSEGGGFRETRGMRARRIAQNGEMSQLSATAAENQASTLEPDNFRSQETNTYEYHREGDDDDDEEEPSRDQSLEVLPIEIDDDYEDDDQLRATLRSVNEMVSAILSWD